MLAVDDLLGLVGGLSSIVWAALSLVMGGYQSFKFENSLISSIYPTSPLDYDNQQAPSSEAKARRDVMKTVSERGKYFYSYAEYLFAKMIAVIFCCCREGKFV